MKLDDILQGKQCIGVSGHINPDGDCVGSVLGVYNYIATYYPEMELHAYLEPIPNIFKFLQNSYKLERAGEDEKEFDLFICCDCRDDGRLGPSAHYFRGAKHTLCIDHHLGNFHFAETEYIFPEASSACELVAELMDIEKITKEIAECLYTGMVTDTGVFQYSSTSSKTMNLAGTLMDKGIAYSDIIDNVFYKRTFEQLQILAVALQKAKRYCNDRIIVSYVTKEEMDACGVLPKHLEGIVSQLRVTKGVEVSVFLSQRGESEYRVSTRATGDKVNLAEIAATFGGGGHAKAAGFSVFEKPEVAIAKIVEKIARAFEE